MGVIMKHMDKNTAIKNMFNMLLFISKKLKLYKLSHFNLCLELLSGSKNDLFFTLSSFSKFYNLLLKNKYLKHIKVCLDICHLFVSGVNFNNINSLNNFFINVLTKTFIYYF